MTYRNLRRAALCLAPALALFLAFPADAAPLLQDDEKKEEAAADPMEAIADFIEKKAIDKENTRWRTRLPKPPKQSFPTTKKYFWNLETSEGAIKIELMPQVAPMHATSTIYLTELGYYDGLTFHRVINGFMAQGGCPLGSGTGGPGYKYGGEFDPKVKHDRPGLLSMANAGPNTDGSQFFITFVPTPHLNNRHTIFGEVVEGMEVVKALEKQGTRSGRPKKEMSIEKATISVEDVKAE